MTQVLQKKLKLWEGGAIALAWASPMLISALWGAMYFAGDRWWPAAMLLFGPRWMLLAPVLMLVPLTVLKSKWCWLPLIASVLIILWPVMGFNIPQEKLKSETSSQARTLRVVTCNLDSANFDTSVLASMIKELAADVVAFQEYPADAKLLLPAGWNIIRANGLGVASHYPLKSVKAVQIKPAGEKWPGTFLLHTVVSLPGHEIAFCSIHLPTPRYGLMHILDKTTLFRPDRSGLFQVQADRRKFISQELSRYIDGINTPVIIAGDFNTPMESPLMRQVWGDFHNAFTETAWGYGWTQRAKVAGFTYSARIDHILTGRGAIPRLSQVGKDIGSGHLPLIADIIY